MKAFFEIYDDAERRLLTFTLRPTGWIFILEGIITVLVAFWAYWAFHDYPDTVVFLSERERQEIARRLDADRGSLAEEYDQKYLWQAFKDWKVWMHCFNFLG